ncbi:MAG: efflux RND transporter periplasmic adaptor subunit [Armatimonadetes bacterium]|nr:efflux RND transporter periplasmic adaptor subunit [Armatimonadota bacterium]
MLKKIVLILVVVGALAGGVVSLRLRAKAKEKPEIQTAKVERGDVVETVTATGSLQPLTTVDIKSKAGGRVDVLAVDVGSEVKPGDLIAKIDPTDTLTNLRTATADADASRARVDQAQKNLELQRTQLRTQVIQAEKALEAARSRLAQAKKQAVLQPKLTRSSIAQAQANLVSAQQAKRELDEATIPQARASVKAAYDQAKANLETAEAAQTQLNEATLPLQLAQARTALAQAEANLDIAKKEMDRQKELRDKKFVAQSAVDTAQNRYDLAVAQRTSATERINTIEAERSGDRRAAELRVTQSQAALSSARRKLDTLDTELAAQRAAAEARVTQAQAQLDNAQANSVQDELRQEDVAAAEASVAQAEASLESARANKLQTDIRAADIQTARAGVAGSEARLQNANTQYEQTTIVAPRAGIILQRYVEQGTIITSGTSAIAQGTNLVQLGDLSRMFVEVLVDETDVGAIEDGQAVDITVDAYSNELFEGKVTHIDPQAMTTQNVTTIKVKVEVENPDARLKPGMNASCEFIIDRAENVLYIPGEAVKEDDNGQFQVTLLLAGDKQETRKVQTGITGGDSTEIKSGLKEGDTVITAIIEPTTSRSSGTGGRGGTSRFMTGPMGGMPRGGGGGGGRR